MAKIELKEEIHYIFVDTETTGLDPHVDKLLEIGIVLCNFDLQSVAGWSWTIAEDGWKEQLESNAFVHDMHIKSGLKHDIEDHGQSISHVVKEIHEFFEESGIPKGTLEMAGSTIGFDRNMIAHRMPEILDWFHYRVLDVSSFKVALKRRNSPIAEKWEKMYPKSESTHRALDDIYHSILELKYYMKALHAQSGS